VAAASLVGVAAAAQSSSPRLDLTAAARAAEELPRLHSLLVSWRGEIVLEHYKRRIRATQTANIKSASKSVIGTLVGIALDRGLIKSLREPIAAFFPEMRRDKDPRKQAITVEDLLTMRSGLESTSGQNYGRWVNSANWVSHALNRPLVSDPGTGMQYSTGSSHLLSAILTKATGMSTWQFAQNTLAQPLKFTLARWTRDPQGIYFGGNEMGMTPRQLIAYGELYLHRGRAHGQQVVPAAWVDTSCVARTFSRYDADREYGYGWWIDELGGHHACFAWGFGGQYVLVFRDLQLVVVATSDPTVSDERRGYRRQLLALIEHDIVEAVDE
jgi:CubicO group peptidase (beta-lactamase class C family)